MTLNCPHIGIVAPEFPPDIGGMQVYAYEYVQELVRRGYRVTVYTERHKEGEIKADNYEIKPVLQRRRRLDKVILENGEIDIWHIMNTAYAWLALESPAVIGSVHGNDFLRPYILTERLDIHRFPVFWRFSGALGNIDRQIGQMLTNRIVRKCLPRLAHILTNSRYTESVLLEKYPSCAGRTTAAMVGVSDFFLNQSLPVRAANEKKRFVTLCRLSEPRKNVGLVIDALSRLQEHYDFHFTVIGDGPLKPQLRDLARNAKISERVTFTGYLSNESIRECLGLSDLFILTSSITPESHEGFGIVYLEANACGTPVLAARLAGAAEAVDENRSGYFVETPTTDNIEQALRDFLEGKISFKQQECRAFAEGFSWKRVVDQGIAAYDSVLSCS